MKKLLISLTVASLLSTSAFAINAKQKERHGDAQRSVMASLSLSDQQKQDIKQIRKETRQDMNVYREENKQFRESMRSIMQATTWDEAEVSSLLEQHMTVNLQRKLIEAKAKNKVFNQLTDAQKAEFVANKASNKGNRKGKNPERKMQRLVKALKLDEQQQAQISEMMTANKAERLANKAQVEGVRSALKNLVQASEFDESAWLAIHAEHKQQKLDMMLNKTKSRFDMLAVLNEQQREKFSKMMRKNKKGKMNKKRGERKAQRDSVES